MLIPLLRTYLRPYGRPIAMVLVFQFVQTLANLYLPGLNADIIDKGVVTGDTGYIMKTGVVMLLITLVQIVCATVAVFFGARTAMALGRDLRAGVFNKVETFAAREVSSFGAATLITRSTNDVQQVQMIVFMTFTFMVAAPIMCVGGIVLALRQDVKLSTLLVVVVPALAISVGLVIRKMRPLFRQMQKKIDTINRIMREQITGIRVIRAFVKEGYERERFGVANRDNMTTAIAVGRLMSLMFPIVMLTMNVSLVAATWFGGYRIGNGSMQVGTLVAFQSYLIQILMSVMMATFMFMLFPRAEVRGRAHHRGARHRAQRRRPGRGRASRRRGRTTSSCVASASPIREPKRTCCTASTWWRSLARPPPSSAPPAAARAPCST